MRKINMQMTQISPNKSKKLQCQGDDVFANIFIPAAKSYKEMQRQHDEEAERKRKQAEREERQRLREIQYGSDASSASEESNHSSERADIEDGSWKNDQYWALPENVRNAIDVAKMKKKHSDFYYKLRLLNDKIHIYTSIFYSKVPNYQKKWYEAKKKILEEKLQK